MRGETEAFEDWGAKECLEAGRRSAKRDWKENLPLLAAFIAAGVAFDAILSFGPGDAPSVGSQPLAFVAAWIPTMLLFSLFEAYACSIFALRAARDRDELRPLSAGAIPGRLPALTAARLIPETPFLVAAAAFFLIYLPGGESEIPPAAWLAAALGAVVVLATLPIVLSLSLADEIILLEGCGLRRALRRSRELTRGRLMMVLSLGLRRLGLGALLGAASAILILLAGFLARFIAEALRPGSPVDWLRRYAEPLIDAGVQAVLLPWFSGAWLFLAASLGAGAPAPALGPEARAETGSASRAGSDEEPAFRHDDGSAGQPDPSAAELDPE